MSEVKYVAAGSPEASRLAGLSHTDEWEHGVILYPNGDKWFTGGGSGGMFVPAATLSNASPAWMADFDPGCIPAAYRGFGGVSGSGPPPGMYDRRGNYKPPFNEHGEYEPPQRVSLWDSVKNWRAR